MAEAGATRGVLNAVLWILGTGAPWADLPRYLGMVQLARAPILLRAFIR